MPYKKIETMGPWIKGNCRGGIAIGTDYDPTVFIINVSPYGGSWGYSYAQANHYANYILRKLNTPDPVYLDC